MRKIGLGRALYQKFFEICIAHSRLIVRSCTSPVNKLSIGFHQRMGFAIEPGDSIVDGVPVVMNYLRDNDPKVLFKKELEKDTAANQPTQKAAQLISTVGLGSSAGYF